MATFNVTLMNVGEYVNSHRIHQVRKLNIFEPSTQNRFESEGLFSEEIFGQIGSPDRLRELGYISLNSTIVHPILFKIITKFGAKYEEIMAGRQFAIWDDVSRDFSLTTPSDPNGSTGYTFFISHFKDIKFSETESDTRRMNIEVFNKFKDNSGLIRSMIVLPAGLRDVIIDGGHVQKDAINDIYTAILGLSNSLAGAEDGDALFDMTRYQIQMKLAEHDEYLDNITTGKTGFLQSGGYSSRKLTYGTRNVISSITAADLYPYGPSSIKSTEVMVGIYQTAKGLTPLTKYNMRTAFFTPIFGTGDASEFPVIDPKTFKLAYVAIDPKEVQKFLSSEGLDDTISRFKNKDVKKSIVTILGQDGKAYPLFLVYDQGDTISIARSITDIESSMEGPVDTSKLRFMTWVELLYLATYQASKGRHATVTRYPVLGMGSSYPAEIHLRSTENARVVNLLDLTTGQLTLELPQYPTLDSAVNFIDSTIVHPSMLPGLGGDHDGDTVSVNYVMSEEGNDACRAYLNDIRAYVSPDSGIMIGGSSDIINFTLKTITQDPVMHKWIDNGGKVSNESFEPVSTETISPSSLKRLTETLHGADMDRRFIYHVSESKYADIYPLAGLKTHTELEVLRLKYKLSDTRMMRYSHEVNAFLGNVTSEMADTLKRAGFTKWSGRNLFVHKIDLLDPANVNVIQYIRVASSNQQMEYDKLHWADFYDNHKDLSDSSYVDARERYFTERSAYLKRYGAEVELSIEDYLHLNDATYREWANTEKYFAINKASGQKDQYASTIPHAQIYVSGKLHVMSVEQIRGTTSTESHDVDTWVGDAFDDVPVMEEEFSAGHELFDTYSSEGIFDTLAELSTYVRVLKVEEIGNKVAISNVRAPRVLERMKAMWKTTRLAKNVFIETTRTGITFHKFFVPEVLFILEAIKPTMGLIDRAHLDTLISLLWDNTWISKYENAGEYKPDWSNVSKTLNITSPFSSQVRLIEKHATARVRNVQGDLFDSPPGTGKTKAGLLFKEVFHFKKCIILCPLPAVVDPWVLTITDVVKDKNVKVWTSTGAGNADMNDAEYLVCHYESLPKLEATFKDDPKESLLFWVDESHNLNEESARRTMTYVDLAVKCRDVRPITQDSDYPHFAAIHASGTPLKGRAHEVIPFLTVADPTFDSTVRSAFIGLFGAASTKALDILNHRMDRMKLSIHKGDIVDIVPTESILRVKITDGDRYTLTSVKESVRKFVEEETDLCKKEMPLIEARLQTVHAYFAANAHIDQQVLAEYLAGIKSIRASSFGDRDIELMKRIKTIETDIFAQHVKNVMDPKVWKRDIAIYKYTDLYVRGRALGVIVTGERIKMISAMVDHVDLASITDTALKKTLIFSSFVNVVDKAAAKLSDAGYDPMIVHQATNKNLTSMLTNFRKDPSVNPICATFSSLGTAIPLTECSTVVLLNEPFRAYIRDQAISRAARYGQDGPVEVVSVLLDTGAQKNLSERSLDIMEFAKDIVDSILGTATAFQDMSVEEFSTDIDAFAISDL